MSTMNNGMIKDIFEETRVVVLGGERKILEPDREAILESVNKLSKKSKNVLGILEGVYFVPDGYSRNKRFYPRELWENVLKQVVPSLSSIAMLGTLEHPTTEEAAHPKNASHVVRKLWIGKDGKGYGRSYILNTPIGSLVYILGSSLDEDGNPLVPLYMSSRGLGKISGYTQNGYEVVDPKTYVLESFDVVLNPGFVDAKPGLSGIVESVLPEVLDMDKRFSRGEEVFSFVESFLRSQLPEEEEGALGYTGRPEGFIQEEVVPINENEKEDQLGRVDLMEKVESLAQEDPGVVKEVAEVEGALEAPNSKLVPEIEFVEASEGLSQEDLMEFVRLAESQYASEGNVYVAGPSAPKQSQEDQAKEPAPEVQVLMESLSLLKREVSRLSEEVRALQVRLLVAETGVEPEKAKKILESHSWNLDRALAKTSSSSSGKRKKQVRHVEMPANVPIEESKEEERVPGSGEVEILSSILKRIGL